MKRYIRSAIIPLKSLPSEEKCDIAHNPSTSPREFAALAKDKSVYVRQAVAQSKYTPKEVLLELIYDEKWSVRERAMRNNTLTIDDLFQALGNYGAFEWICRERAEASDTTPEDFARLAKSEDTLIRILVAENLHTPRSVLLMLADDPYERVRQHVRKHPYYPGDQK